MLGRLPVAGAQHKARQNGKAAAAGQAPLGVCLQFSKTAGRERCVLFEHPSAATSWNEPWLEELLAIDWMRRTCCDQCQFGLIGVDDAGNVGRARKSTGFMTNDEHIAEAVDRRCFGVHDHIQLLNQLATPCETYPPRVAAILRALRRADRRSQLTGSTSTSLTRSGPTTGAGWSVKRRAEDWAATFAAIPPYEAFRLQQSFMMTCPRWRRRVDAAGHFPSTSPLTACMSLSL